MHSNCRVSGTEEGSLYGDDVGIVERMKGAACDAEALATRLLRSNVELGREENRGVLQDLVGESQIAALTFECAYRWPSARLVHAARVSNGCFVTWSNPLKGNTLELSRGESRLGVNSSRGRPQILVMWLQR